MLRYCLTASEGAGDSSHTTLGDGKHTVNNTLSGNQRHVRRQFFLIRTSSSHRPFLHQAQLFFSVFCFQYAHCLFYVKRSSFDLFDLTFYIRRYHDFLSYNHGFLYGTKDISAFYFIADLGCRHKFPFLITFQGRHLNTTFQAVASGCLHNIIQRSLDTIVDTGDQARTQFHGKGYFRRLNRFTGTKT